MQFDWDTSPGRCIAPQRMSIMKWNKRDVRQVAGEVLDSSAEQLEHSAIFIALAR